MREVAAFPFGYPGPRKSAGGQMGVFARMMEGLSSAGAERKMVMIDATWLIRRAA